jgi:hypothetical protein
MGGDLPGLHRGRGRARRQGPRRVVSAATPARWLLVSLTQDELDRVRAWALRNGYGTDAAGRRLLLLGLDVADPVDGPRDLTAQQRRWIEEHRGG